MIAQKRYDDANGDFKEIAGPGARLVVEKYKKQFSDQNEHAQAELASVLKESQVQLSRVTMNYMQVMGQHYRTIRGSYEPFKGIDIASIR